MKRCKKITRYSQFLDFGGRCWIAFYSSSVSSGLCFLRVLILMRQRDVEEVN